MNLFEGSLEGPEDLSCRRYTLGAESWIADSVNHFPQPAFAWGRFRFGSIPVTNALCVCGWFFVFYGSRRNSMVLEVGE
ncbi:hypothetical protein SAMN05421770_11127 [Granulicella rosea]|uniref:Uncharacterized protein n=1 Tax=Granulicella rosea TaxID=474952 RepID=A0A239MBM1_9BACT|nr:hypothetical protein SAMN05421770_11127 [Granulicella rosea]